MNVTAAPLDESDSRCIDAEHQVQLELIQAVCDAAEEERDHEQMLELLARLIEYSNLHFMSEQLLMRLYAYPDFDDHIADHDAMMDSLDAIKRESAIGNKRVAVEHADGLRAVLTRHIQSRDDALARFLANSQGAVGAPER